MTTNSAAEFDPATSSIPLYATEGGGYATFLHGQRGLYVWHSEIPDFLCAQVGDPIPAQWGVVAINEAARREVEDFDDDPWNGDVNDDDRFNPEPWPFGP